MPTPHEQLKKLMQLDYSAFSENFIDVEAYEITQARSFRNLVESTFAAHPDKAPQLIARDIIAKDSAVEYLTKDVLYYLFGHPDGRKMATHSGQNLCEIILMGLSSLEHPIRDANIQTIVQEVDSISVVSIAQVFNEYPQFAYSLDKLIEDHYFHLAMRMNGVKLPDCVDANGEPLQLSPQGYLNYYQLNGHTINLANTYIPKKYMENALRHLNSSQNLRWRQISLDNEVNNNVPLSTVVNHPEELLNLATQLYFIGLRKNQGLATDDDYLSAKAKFYRHLNTHFPIQRESILNEYQQIVETIQRGQGAAASSIKEQIEQANQLKVMMQTKMSVCSFHPYPLNPNHTLGQLIQAYKISVDELLEANGTNRIELVKTNYPEYDFNHVYNDHAEHWDDWVLTLRTPGSSGIKSCALTVQYVETVRRYLFAILRAERAVENRDSIAAEQNQLLSKFHPDLKEKIDKACCESFRAAMSKNRQKNAPEEHTLVNLSECIKEFDCNILDKIGIMLPCFRSEYLKSTFTPFPLRQDARIADLLREYKLSDNDLYELLSINQTNLEMIIAANYPTESTDILIAQNVERLAAFIGSLWTPGSQALRSRTQYNPRFHAAAEVVLGEYHSARLSSPVSLIELR